MEPKLMSAQMPSSSLYPLTISYDKLILSGLLAGLSIPVSYGTTSDAAPIRLARLREIAAKGAKDCQGNRFKVANIRVEEAAK